MCQIYLTVNGKEEISIRMQIITSVAEPLQTTKGFRVPLPVAEALHTTKGFRVPLPVAEALEATIYNHLLQIIDLPPHQKIHVPPHKIHHFVVFGFHKNCIPIF